MIVVAGASGTLGPLLVPLLVERGEPVRVVTRDPGAASRKLSGVELISGDVTRPEDARRAVAGARVVVSAITGFASPAGLQGVDVEGNRILADAAVRAGVEQFVLLSVAQASADHPMALFRAKFAAEQAVRASSVGWTMIRPTAYLETWLGLIGGPLVAKGRTIVFGRGRNPINFVSVRDVAALVERVATDQATRGQTLEIGGPDNLTFDQLARMVAADRGDATSPRHLPRAVLRTMAVIVGRVRPELGCQARAALAMDHDDLSFDNTAVRTRFADLPCTSAADLLA